MKQKVYFRADAGVGIGYGHFIRSLALADMLKSDFECVMFTQSPTPYQMAEAEKICQLVALSADESRFDKFLTYLTGDEIVVLDNYFFTTEYQQQIKDKGCKLVCIDDMHDKHFVSDVVINHAMGVFPKQYDMESYTKLYLGLDYLLLRHVFRMAADKQPMEVKRTMHSYFVCFGGSDDEDFTTRTTRVILDFDAQNKVFVVIGDSYTGKIETIQKQYGERIQIVRNVSAEQMCDLMLTADAAIVPASSIFFEVCSVRLPIVSGFNVDNQIDIARESEQMGLCIGLGNMKEYYEDKLWHALGEMGKKAMDIKNKQRNIVKNSEYNLKHIFMDLAQKESYIKLPISKGEFVDKLLDSLEISKNPFHPMVFFNGIESCEIGKDVYIGYLSEVNAKGAKVVLGDRCDIASFVSINVADSHKRCVGILDHIERGNIILEHDVFVGSHCFIGGGCHIGHHSVVAAGTILIKGGDIPPYSLIQGNPATIIPNYYKR